jgi:hypothetical protein
MYIQSVIPAPLVRVTSPERATHFSQAARHGLLYYRQAEAQTIFVSPAAPPRIKESLVGKSWDKTSFDVKALIGKTQVVWVYDAVCKFSGMVCALKCYRKETQSLINYQYGALRQLQLDGREVIGNASQRLATVQTDRARNECPSLARPRKRFENIRCLRGFNIPLHGPAAGQKGRRVQNLLVTASAAE